MFTIACVLKQGTFFNRHKKVVYTPEDVEWLYDMIKCHVTVPYKFVCLSNVDVPCERIALINDWPGWWSKIELFRKDLFKTPVLYIDLDTVILRNIDEVFKAEKNRMIMLRNLSSGKGVGSGLMIWDGDFSFLYRNFAKYTEKWVRKYATPKKWGDQAFIEDRIENVIYFQDRHPNMVKSLNFDLLGGKLEPDEYTKIVAFHGFPKPKEVDLTWVPKYKNV